MSDYGVAVTNGGSQAESNGNSNGATSAKAQELDANLAAIREKGWNNPIPFKYELVGTGAAPADTEDLKWAGEAGIYVFADEVGDIGERDERLEEELFRGDHLMKAGNHIQALSFEVKVLGVDPVPPIRSFEDAGLHPAMLENVRNCGYHIPTPIQAYTLPAVLTGHDVVGIAQTGSGKTAAYLIPILSRLMGKARILAAPRPNPARYNPMTDRVRAEPLVLIVCPTRELACQIFDEARRLCYRTMLRPCVIYGGAPTKLQREQLEMGCDVLIATPGRLMDFMNNLNLLSLHRLKYTVIDEADELLSQGWEEIMEKLFAGSAVSEDADHTYLMFSATFPKAARKLARDYMESDLVRIKVGRVGSTHQNIKQNIVYVDESAKNQALFDLIMSGPAQRTLVFVNAKSKCDMVDDFLYNKGLPSTSLHSDRTQREREDALRSFKLAKTPIMVATGVTARGLDVANVKHVINYDLPSTTHDGITEYVHRIGRTARIGNEGVATSFYNDRNEDIGPDLVKILIEANQEIPDFLEQFKPANPDDLFLHEDTDDESDNGLGGGNAFTGGFGNDSFGGDETQGADEGSSQPEGKFNEGDTEDKVGSW